MSCGGCAASVKRILESQVKMIFLGVLAFVQFVNIGIFIDCFAKFNMIDDVLCVYNMFFIVHCLFDFLVLPSIMLLDLTFGVLHVL